MIKQPKFIIIDGDSFIHRAYHGYKTHNKKYSNEDNYAIKGFTSMLSKELNNREFDYLAVVFDHQGKTFRHDLSPLYKANRAPKEAAFLKQIDIIHEFVIHSGLPYICMEYVEGDDVIGYLAKKGQSLDWEIDILSGDKDLAQIIDNNTKIVDTRFKREISLTNIEEHFGVTKPEHIIDLLALFGDKADNIFGLESCGKKTALKLIKDFDTIENIINATEEEIFNSISKIARNKSKVAHIIKQLKEEPDKLLLAKQLTTLKLDLKMNLTMKDIKIKENRFDKKRVQEIISTYSLNPHYSIPEIILKWYN